MVAGGAFAQVYRAAWRTLNRLPPGGHNDHLRMSNSAIRRRGASSQDAGL
jgi:hypothetical protein